MATSRDDVACVFCLQPSTSLSNYRVLQCNHLGCLSCIEDISSAFEELVCSHCSVKSKTADLSIEHAGKSTEAGNGGALVCDICKDKSAAVFCVTCQKILCANHEKEDQEKAVVIGHPVHFHVKIAHFLLNKQAYVRLFCKQHTDKEISQACKECKQTYCLLCHTEGDCPSTKRDHSLSSLAAVAKTVQDQAKNFQSLLTEKCARYLELTKDAFRKMESIKETTDRLVSEVDKIVKEQIELITQEGERTKQQIASMDKNMNKRADKFVKRVMSFNKEAEDHLSSLQAITQLTSPGLVLEKFSAIESKVKTVSNVNLTPFTLPTKGNLPTSITVNSINLEVKLQCVGSNLDVDPVLTLVNEVKTTGDSIYSVKWISCDVMVTGGRKVSLVNSQLKEIKHIELPCAYHVILFKDKLVVLQKQHDSTKTIKVYSKQLEKIGDFATLPSKTTELSKIAAVNDRILASDPTHKCLHIWDSFGNPLPKLDLSFMKSPRGVFATSDGRVLVCDASERGSIRKYNISTSYSCEWISDELEYPWSIAVTNDGKIFVNSNKPTDQAIYKLSAEGKLLARFTCDQLRCLKDVNDISIIGDKLTAACRGSGVKLFQVT